MDVLKKKYKKISLRQTSSTWQEIKPPAASLPGLGHMPTFRLSKCVPSKWGSITRSPHQNFHMCGVREREVSKKEKSIPRRKVSWSPYCEISMRLLNRRFYTNFIRGPLHKIFYFHFHNMRSAFIIPLSKSEFLIFLGLNHISLLYIAPSIMPGTQQMFKHYF